MWSITALDALCDALATRHSSSTVANPYTGPHGIRRLDNLRRFLCLVAAECPSVLLVGEAPGYRGCAVTGVPFTSRSLFAADLGRWGLFNSFAFDADETLGVSASEISATVVWRAAVQSLERPPVTWNAFPFHPHRSDDRQSNRPLQRAELEEGGAYLRQMLTLFTGVPVLAVGRQAERALEAIDHQPVATLRHPAHGGAGAFTRGFVALAHDLRAPPE